MVRERPILFSGPMVRAILDGRKTQTRRVIVWSRVTPSTWTGAIVGAVMRLQIGFWQAELEKYAVKSHGFRCPHGVPGDRLWVRETWMDLTGTGIEPFTAAPTRYAYASDTPAGSYGDECRKQYGLKWRPSIFMPRQASRITLEITNVRAQKVKEISEEDALAEGVQRDPFERVFHINGQHGPANSARDSFACLWDSINAKKAPWESNPWVWAITFRQL